MSQRISTAPSRRFRRLMVRIAVDVQPADGCAPEDEFAAFDAVATTLGAGGLFIPTESPLMQGHPLRVCFALSGSEEQHEITGRVVWCNRGPSENSEPASRSTPGMGIEFLDRVAAARLARELEHFLATTER